MKSSYSIFASLILMALGEVLTIYSEVYASRLPSGLWASPELLIKPMLMICVAGISLVIAYWLGYQATGNIWVITVASLTMLLILEPVVIYLMLEEVPQRGAIIGFILGTAGLICTVLL